MAGHSALPPGAVLGENVEPPWAGLAGGLPGNPGEGANPFSFKAFVRSQEQKEATAASWHGGTKTNSPQGSLRSYFLLDESSLAESVGSNKDLREPFFEDPTALDSLLQEDEDDWSGSYQPSAVEEAHLLRAPSASLSSSPLNSFSCNLSELQTFSPDQLGGNDHLSCRCLGKGDQSSPSGGMSPEDGLCRLLQLRYQEKRSITQILKHRKVCEALCEKRSPNSLCVSQPKLKEENSKFRSTLSQIQAVSDSQAERIRHLERTLEKNKRKEEKEAHELEAMVQQVEENLQLMTKRAMKAENSIIKLKQENLHLQVQLKNYKLENKALRSGHLESLAVVKQNADVALQNLLAVITRSKSSIKQLVSGAEELQLVADLLKSLDKISEIPSQGTP